MSGHYIRPVLAGLGIFAAVYGIEAALTNAGAHGPGTFIYGALLGAFAGLALHCYLGQLDATRELRRRTYHENLISQLNHHVRNALQLILNRAELEIHNVRELGDIQNAVSRIDWALREILPRVTAGTAPKSSGSPFLTTSNSVPPPRPCSGLYPVYVSEKEKLMEHESGADRSRTERKTQTSVFRNKGA